MFLAICGTTSDLPIPGPPHKNIGLLIFSACNILAFALLGESCLVVNPDSCVLFLGILFCTP